MKCTKCYKHYKAIRNLEDTTATCPDCQPVGNTVRLEQLFEEILKRHVVLVELRDIYRHKLNKLLNVQK